MPSVNKVILIGHLGRDPEIRYTDGGVAVANMSLATTDKIRDEEKTEWHRLVAFARVAEVCGEYLVKGSQIYVDGRLQTREWEDKGGSQSTEIVVNQMVMLGGKSKEQPPPKSRQPRQQQPYGPPPDDPAQNEIPF